jgi:hypothetical protein
VSGTARGRAPSPARPGRRPDHATAGCGARPPSGAGGELRGSAARVGVASWVRPDETDLDRVPDAPRPLAAAPSPGPGGTARGDRVNGFPPPGRDRPSAGFLLRIAATVARPLIPLTQ